MARVLGKISGEASSQRVALLQGLLQLRLKRCTSLLRFRKLRPSAFNLLIALALQAMRKERKKRKKKKKGAEGEGIKELIAVFVCKLSTI